jgi:hypothetical protein
MLMHLISCQQEALWLYLANQLADCAVMQDNATAEGHFLKEMQPLHEQLGVKETVAWGRSASSPLEGPLQSLLQRLCCCVSHCYASTQTIATTRLCAAYA